MSQANITSEIDAIDRTCEIVSAYVSNNSLPSSDLPRFIGQVYAAICGLGTSVANPPEEVERPTPAQIKKSITPDALVSFIDGKPYKTLKRHLSTHGLDLRGYRERYGLPSNYPSVAPNYAARRSALAKSIGLGVPKRSEAA